MDHMSDKQKEERCLCCNGPMVAALRCLWCFCGVRQDGQVVIRWPRPEDIPDGFVQVDWGEPA